MRWLALFFLLTSGCHQGNRPNGSSVPSPEDRDLDSDQVLNLDQPTREDLAHRSRVRAGETLSTILADAGVDSSRSWQAAKLLQEHMDIHRIPAQSAYTLCRDTSGDLRTLVFHVSPFQDVTLEMTAGMRARVDHKEARAVTRKAQGVVTNSLHRTLVDGGHPTGLATALQNVFGRRVNFRRLTRGTQFQVLYTQQEVEGKPIGLERVLGARIHHRGKVLQAFLHQSEGHNYYFDEKGIPLNEASLPSPVKASRISSPYSRNRFHPILKRSMPHLGTDYAAPHGSAVVAVADGVVIAARHARYNGNFVKIKHDAVFQTQYLHLSSFPESMYEGKRVKRGETIGFVGNTGLAAGTHLCFRFWKNGRQVDPRVHQLTPGTDKVAGPAFQNTAAAIARSLGPFPEG